MLPLNSMGRKMLQMEEKFCVLTLLKKGDSVIAVARDLGVSIEAIYQLMLWAASLPTRMVPQRMPGSDAPKKTTPMTDSLLKLELLSKPSIATVELKTKFPELLQNVISRTIRLCLQKDMDLPSRRAVKKPMLTVAMKKKRLGFCKKYKD